MESRLHQPSKAAAESVIYCAQYHCDVIQTVLRKPRIKNDVTWNPRSEIDFPPPSHTLQPEQIDCVSQHVIVSEVIVQVNVSAQHLDHRIAYAVFHDRAGDIVTLVSHASGAHTPFDIDPVDKQVVAHRADTLKQ